MGAGINGIVFAMAWSPYGSLFVGGAFLGAGGAPAYNIAEWQANWGCNGTWCPLKEGVGVDGNPATGSVTALTAGEAHLYVGGNFTNAGSHPSTHFAVWGMRPRLGVAAHLQGVFHLLSESMFTSLRDDGLLPLTQPYHSAPWSYEGEEAVTTMPAGVVDWVLLEARSGTPGSSMDIIARVAGLLKADGTVTGPDGIGLAAFSDLPDGSYYVVLRHRNHIDIMSAEPVSIVGGIPSWDFRTAATRAYGADAQADLGNGYFGLYAGDANADGQVTAPDFNLFLQQTQQGGWGYLGADLNLDGQVTAPDFNLILQNTTRGAATRFED